MTRISSQETSPQNSWRDTILPPRKNKLSGLCLILDQELLPGGAERAMISALAAGAGFFQYRSKQGSRKDIFQAASVLVRISRDAGALFIVNDHADIAVAVDADGVHLGQDDLPIAYARKLLGSTKLIGISTHSPEQAQEAETSGADYIGFGPIFTTATKDAGPTQGLERIAAVKRATSLPLIAIGGITRDNVRSVLSAGADGVAIISAILNTPDIAASTEYMMRSMRFT